jgi:hypothetical protein
VRATDPLGRSLMGRFSRVIATCALFGASGWAFCDDHVVSPAAAQARLSKAAAERDRDVQVIEHALSTPEAASAAAALGTTLERVQTAVPTLSGPELHELASRATLLGIDPVAGDYEFPVHDFLVIFLVVAIVVLVIGAVNS